MDRKTLDTRIEFKFLDANGTDEKTFTGYGAFFGNIDSYGDTIAPGAFANTLAEFKANGAVPAMLWNHDACAMPIGIWAQLSEDGHGLKVSGQFLNTTTGNDAYLLAKSGAVTGLSIGYTVTGFEMSTQNGRSIRTITEVKLYEISLVTFPANDLARVQSVKTETNEEIEVKDEIKSLIDMMTKMDGDIASIRDLIEQKSTKESDDGAGDENGDPSDDGDETDDEPEDEDETKYIDAAVLAAVQTLIVELKQEKHGR
jgi:HK97 family phage prohead protease